MSYLTLFTFEAVFHEFYPNSSILSEVRDGSRVMFDGCSQCSWKPSPRRQSVNFWFVQTTAGFWSDMTDSVTDWIYMSFNYLVILATMMVLVTTLLLLMKQTLSFAIISSCIFILGILFPNNCAIRSWVNRFVWSSKSFLLNLVVPHCS